jgi:fructokinase
VPESVRAGIDVGGTKIHAMAFAGDGAVIFDKRIVTPKDYGAIVQAVAVLADETGAARIGIGAPGSSSPVNGLWRNANIVVCNGQPFHQDLAQTIGIPIKTENDANCFALSEAFDGAGQGHDVVAFFTIGTGLGGGLVVGGRLIGGAHGEAAEFGHTGLPWPDAEDLPLIPCFCGKNGCTEMYVSGTGLSKDYALRNGVTLTGLEIIRRARAGEDVAIAALTRLQLRFARVCGNLVNMIDPDIIVMGGGLAQLPELVEELSPIAMRYSFSGTAEPKIARAKHGDSSGARGASLLWQQRS